MRTFRGCYGDLAENVLEPLGPDVFVRTKTSVGITNRLNLQAGGRGDDRRAVTRDTTGRRYEPNAVESSCRSRRRPLRIRGRASPPN
jgi:hypothetical protein